MDRPPFIELIRSTKIILNHFLDLARLSRGQFVAHVDAESLQKSISSDIEQIDLLQNGFLNYLKCTAAITKKDTVNTLIEQVLEKHHHRLQERRIGVQKTLEKQLPETAVPDEHMRFIMDSMVQCAIVFLPFGGEIDFSTKSSLIIPRPAFAASIPMDEDYSPFKTIEITAFFTSLQINDEQFGSEWESRFSQREAAMDLLLRLVNTIVQENKGTMAHEVSETRTDARLVLKFPSERRRVVHYQPID
jgi:hypothetical protein